MRYGVVLPPLVSAFGIDVRARRHNMLVARLSAGIGERRGELESNAVWVEER